MHRFLFVALAIEVINIVLCARRSRTRRLGVEPVNDIKILGEGDSIMLLDKSAIWPGNELK
jgi:hypothetical protein